MAEEDELHPYYYSSKSTGIGLDQLTSAAFGLLKTLLQKLKLHHARLRSVAAANWSGRWEPISRRLLLNSSLAALLYANLCKSLLDFILQNFWILFSRFAPHTPFSI